MPSRKRCAFHLAPSPAPRSPGTFSGKGDRQGACAMSKRRSSKWGGRPSWAALRPKPKTACLPRLCLFCLLGLATSLPKWPFAPSVTHQGSAAIAAPGNRSLSEVYYLLGRELFRLRSPDYEACRGSICDSAPFG